MLKSQTYKDEDALRISFPVFRKHCILPVCFGKINRPNLARRITLRTAFGWTSSQTSCKEAGNKLGFKTILVINHIPSSTSSTSSGAAILVDFV
jgi:hypothetical protein